MVSHSTTYGNTRLDPGSDTPRVAPPPFNRSEGGWSIVNGRACGWQGMWMAGHVDGRAWSDGAGQLMMTNGDEVWNKQKRNDNVINGMGYVWIYNKRKMDNMKW